MKLPPTNQRSGAPDDDAGDDARDDAGPLEADELRRYARQMRIPSIGAGGQLRLARSSTLIVGAGGLGSPVAMYLAAAGVGRIGLADSDRVDPSNLHRQLLHRTEDVGQAKVESARRTLHGLNPHVRVDAIDARVSRENALDLITEYDIIIDGTDNFPTRYLLSDACVLTGRPLVSGSVDRFEGQVTVYATEHGPCYRCLYPSPPDPGSVLNCADAGVLGVLPGLIGMLQATEAIKLILGLGESLAGRLLLVDTMAMRFRTISVSRDPDCPVCGTREQTSLIDYDALCSGQQAVEPKVDTISPLDLAAAMATGEEMTLLDVREPYEWQIARLPSARLVPLGSLRAGPPDIPRDANVVVYCHHGQRSRLAAAALLAFGFHRVRNLTGGIDRWSQEVDSGVRRY